MRVDLQFIRKTLILGWPRLTWEVLLWPCLLRRSPGPDEDIIQPALHKRRRRWEASANSADRDIMCLE